MRIHIVGIGGIGMSGIALILNEKGYSVQGSDLRESPIVKRLKERGIKVFIGHSPENVKGADVVIHSSAVKPSNPEIVEAKKLGIPVIPRADVVSDIMRLKEGIAVGGTHGKTTTSSMIATILHSAGTSPTILVGGRLPFLGGDNAALGSGKWIVIEADESDGTFLKLTPTLSVITNVDNDHLDFYGSPEEIDKAFTAFANRVAFYGKVFLCIECPRVRKISPKVYKRKETYGFEGADFTAEEVTQVGLSSIFTVRYKGKKLGKVRLNVPGKHNVLNALGAIAVALETGVPFKEAAEALGQFRNASRRMELKGTVKGITFFDDYGHHPTEIKASYEAIKSAFPNRRVVVLFQPHRFSRTKLLWREFVETLKGFENLFLCDIYPAGEEPIEGIDSRKLASECKAVYAGGLEEACKLMAKVLRPGDVFLSLGAGSVTNAFNLISKEMGE